MVPGTLWGTNYLLLVTRSSPLGHGTCQLVHGQCFFSVGGATLVSLLGNHLPINLTVINYKIFGKNTSSILSIKNGEYNKIK